MRHVPVVIAGGGPVGMTLAYDLARRGISCIVAERNPTTTIHPKMDITNGRSMELFRRAGLEERLRNVAVPEDHCFDVAWITTLAGYELHRFAYPSVAELRARICERNDGSQTATPPMRVSQVIIEPVLKQAIDENDRVEVRFACMFERFEPVPGGVVVVLRDADGQEERVRAAYLIGCDGGGSRVRRQLGIGLTGEARVAQRHIVHFESEDQALLQRWGPAWHYQSNQGTLVAQDDRRVWTLLAQLPPGLRVEDPSTLLVRFAGRPFEHRVLLSNSWEPHLVVADSYGFERVLLAGDAAHQYVPTGGYGMNTGVGDAFDLGWKLAAVLRGFGGAGLISSYAQERRPVGLRNCAASGRHVAVRKAIASLYQPDAQPGPDERTAMGERIAGLGNVENESMGIEHGYAYATSPLICDEAGVVPPDDPIIYQPSTVPGVRLPSIILPDGKPLYDQLGDWFTLLLIGYDGDDGFVVAARALGVPLTVVRIDSTYRTTYDTAMILVRPDQHIAWRGEQADEDDAKAVLNRALGRNSAPDAWRPR
jgi:2-polyprenyl-6-methoxyphenol hydroxylase-like FAD-dependent oxidoreductase